LKIYLENPIELFGEKVGHTYEGLKHLIEHYTHTLAHATAQQIISEPDRQHCEKLIEKLKLHAALYEKQKALNP